MAASNISSTPSTRTTPHCLKAASYTVSVPARLPVCDAAARAPARLHPALTASFGFLTVFAASMNRRPSFSPSMYMAIVQVSLSPSKCSSRSASDTSALFPVLTTQFMPRWEPMAQSTMESPKAPLWVMKEISPFGGIFGTMLAFSPMLLLRNPMVFGPSMRMPCRAAFSLSRSSRAAPSGPVSLKPAVMTHSAFTFFAPHSSTTRSTADEGTMMTARSTSPGTSPTLAWHPRPPMSGTEGFTGYTFPL